MRREWNNIESMKTIVPCVGSGKVWVLLYDITLHKDISVLKV
jgi:hypothetical protein